MLVERMMRMARSCGSGTDLAQVGRLMAEVECGVLPVLGEQAQVVGVLTDRDICLELSRRDQRPSEVQAHEAMTVEPATCRGDEDLREVLERMAQHRVRRLPVVDEDHHLVGILSLDDLVVEVDAASQESVLATMAAVNRHLVPSLDRAG